MSTGTVRRTPLVSDTARRFTFYAFTSPFLSFESISLTKPKRRCYTHAGANNERASEGAPMTLEHREQGHARQEILDLLRRHGQMTAAELSERLGIGAVGVRQHIALL